MSNLGNIYCYHCRCTHPRSDMKLVESKTGKRWRCQQSLTAAKKDRKTREEFGKSVSDANRQRMQMLRQLRNLE